MELDPTTASASCYRTNLNESKEAGSNVGVKTEAPEAYDIQLESLQCAIKSEKLSTAEKLKFANLSKLEPEDISSASSDLKLQKLAQEFNIESIKQELLHEELDIKSEDEMIQEPCLDDLYNCKFTRTLNRAKPFKCNICDYNSVYQGHLKVHLRTHTGEKPFKCSICNYSFKDSSNLRRHLKSHTGEKAFKCSICDYSCVQNSALKMHLTTHTGKKPFQCNICDKNFGRKSNLRAHLMIHTREKPFQCNICDYSCAQKLDLEKHLRTHTGEKPFKCNSCSKRFAQKCNLKTHLRTHSKVHSPKK